MKNSWHFFVLRLFFPFMAQQIRRAALWRLIQESEGPSLVRIKTRTSHYKINNMIIWHLINVIFKSRCSDTESFHWGPCLCLRMLMFSCRTGTNEVMDFFVNWVFTFHEFNPSAGRLISNLIEADISGYFNANTFSSLRTRLTWPFTYSYKQEADCLYSVGCLVTDHTTIEKQQQWKVRDFFSEINNEVELILTVGVGYTLHSPLLVDSWLIRKLFLSVQKSCEDISQNIDMWM